MKLKEIADRINVHLKRFEADPIINKIHEKYHTHPYYYAGAHIAGAYVQVCYVTYQGHSNLTREKAEKYLEWLDAGNVGRHYEALR